jgi:hypothetical protein
MSFAGKLTRGLLQGASGYFGQVAEQQEFDRRAAILAQREEALELLRQSGRSADTESLRSAAPEAGEPASEGLSTRPGAISPDQGAFWNGRTWVPLTAANRPEQQRLERHGQ